MRYLITGIDEPFMTAWFDAENHFADGMVVYDLSRGLYTTDGDVWHVIEQDHL